MKKATPEPVDRTCPECSRVNSWHRGGCEIRDADAPGYPRIWLACRCGYGTWCAHDEIQPRWLQHGYRR